MLKIYKASAGSGKTFTLAREYITLILGEKRDDGIYRLARRGGSRHRHILAITFTNKATEEMKGRIIHELAVLAGREPGWTAPSPYLDYLRELFGCSAGQLMEAAASALDDILHDFNSFNVSTIDAFFQLVLRTFAREAEIDGNYEVELDDERVIALGVDEMLSSLNLRDGNTRDNMYLLRWLETYMTDKVAEGGSFNVFNRSSQLHANLIKFFKNISGETFVDNEKQIMDYLDDPQRLTDFDKHLASAIGAARRATADACSAAVEHIAACGCEGVLQKNTLGMLKAWIKGRRADGKDPGATPRNILDDPDKAYLKAGVSSPLRTAHLDTLIAEACRCVTEGYESTRFLEILRGNLFHLGLLKRLNECISSYRKENSTIMLSDTNAILRRIIGKDDTPFVYERLGQELEHFLIDEFQDTSPLQWENLLPLVETSMSRSKDCLVIGDEKQCIYRFRNSEPRLLMNLHSAFEGECDSRGTSPQENTNWRSSAEVVRFNNTLFMALASVTGNAELYKNVVQLVSPKHIRHQGYVKVRDFDALGKMSGDERRAAMLDAMTEELQSALDAGYKPKDVAVLVRTRKEGERVIEHLMRLQSEEGRFKNVRIVSDQSILVSSSGVVRLIISVLRFLTATDDVTSSRKKSRREIARLLNRYEFFRSRNLTASRSLIEALSSPEVIEEIASEAIAVNCLNLPTVVERIITRYVTPADRLSQNLFICAFQDLVNDFVKNGNGDIRSFLEWWDEKGYRTPVAGVADDLSLSVLTIHKAKGLEYKVVLLPFAGAKEVTVKEVKWFEMPEIPGIPSDIIPPFIPINCTSALEGTPFQQEFLKLQGDVLMDELNVFYVALTRAVDRLYVGLAVTRGTSVADYVRDAIAACTPDYVANLSAEVPVEKGSEYMPLATGSDGIMEIGTPTVAGVDKKADVTALTPSVAEEMPVYWSSDRDDLWDGTRVDDVSRYDFANARRRGIVIHDLMARIHSLDEVDTVITKMIREGEIPAHEIDEVRSTAHRLLSDDRAARWFEDTERVLIERPVMVDGEEHRPDRVVWTADGNIDIIDYKTGQENPSRYRRQVRRYMDRFAEMGYENVRGYLWYLDSGEIVEVL
ncbi:MAG: UvrD-helicase domain-containing protein [Duncaniella sp.]|nr:UvrD-helicase domain-containing protein [Duncaniella sp.]